MSNILWGMGVEAKAIKFDVAAGSTQAMPSQYTLPLACGAYWYACDRIKAVHIRT